MMTARLLARPATDDRAPVATALACLALIGRMNGLALSAESLVADNGLPPGEIDGDTLVACADRAGFRCKALLLQWRDMGALKRALPAIVGLRDGRSLVLTRIEDGRAVAQATLIDPAIPAAPRLVLSRADFEAAWSGDVLLLKRRPVAEGRDKPFGWGVVADLVRAEPRLLRDLTLSTAVLGLLALGPVLLARTLVDDGPPRTEGKTFLVLVAALVLLVLFEGAFAAVRHGLVTRLSARVGLKLSTLVFDRMLRLPLRLYETTPRPILARRLEGIAAVQALLAGPVARATLDAAVAVVLLPAMLAISLPVTAAALAVAMLAFGLVLLLEARQQRALAALEACAGDAGALLAETIGGIRTVTALALGARQRRRWDVLTARRTRLRLAEADAARLLDTVGHAAERLIVYGGFGLGVTLAVTGAHGASRADLFAMLLMSLRLAAPLRDIPAAVRAMSCARAAVTALAALVDGTAETGPGQRGVTAPLGGQIVFTGVDFTYPDAPEPALQSVSFEVPAGTMLGLMGRSGAGKTTVARLLQRLCGDYQGLIKLDGIDVRAFDLDHLRASLAVVEQDSPLFPGTIRENLCLARPDASDEVMRDAVRLVGGEAMIDRLPQGYETLLDEGAVLLSDGQRQRLAIARALIADPAILVLDEATAALDPESEALITGALKRRGGRTLIVIAQRLAALVEADAILVLDRGEVQDMGRHQDLVQRSDLYSGLWRRQTAALGRGGLADRQLTRGAHVA